MNEAIGKLEEGLPSTQKFADAIMVRFDEELYDHFYSEGREPPYTPYDIFIAGDLLDCVDKLLDEDPERWIRRYQHIIEDDDGMSEEDDIELYFRDMLIEGGYL